MAENMRRDDFAGKLRARRRSYGGGSSYDVCGAEACQACLVQANKKRPRLVKGNASFIHQLFQCVTQVVRDRDDPFFASLAPQQHLRPQGIKREVGGVYANCFRNARARPRQEEQ
jgi:hypothetical protein